MTDVPDELERELAELPGPLGWLGYFVASSAADAADLARVAAGREPARVSTTVALRPGFRERFEAFLADARSAGHELRVDETYRTRARQAYLHELYLRGGPRAAEPGKSRHEHGLAADAWPVGVAYDDPAAPALLQSLEPLAARHRLTSGAAYGDYDHWEDTSR